MPPKVQTIGKVILRDLLPEGLKEFDKPLDKKGLASLFTEMAEKYPDQYVDVLAKLNAMADEASTTYGNEASISLKDLELPPRVKEYRQRLRDRVSLISQSNLPMQEKADKIVHTIRGTVDEIRGKVMDEAYPRNNAFAIMAKHGIKSNPTQVTQMLFGDIMVTDHKKRPIAIPGLRGYAEGVSPAEYWAGSYASRAGYASVQFATADTGYLGKQLALMSSRIRVTGDDCGATDLGVSRKGDDPEIIGTVLAEDAGGLKKGTVIDKDNIRKLGNNDIMVRSLITCQQHDGVCKKCAGKQYDNKFPEDGEFIGIRAARALSEPMTQQLGLSAKHTGTTVGKANNDVTGFEEINRFVQIPQRFLSKSILAPSAGKVQQIVKAPQGGYYMHVNNEQLYVPGGRDLIVKKGDDVEAGDMLTDGTPNPAEVAKYKGLGEGRKYFTEKFYDILKSNGIPSHYRNVEVLGRAFFDRAEITNPSGWGEYMMGDIVPYSYIQANYTPRQGAETRSVGKAVGQYLEKPVMHYTIGTPITKKVAADMAKHKVSEIVVHSDEPDFKAAPSRAAGFMEDDQDWKVRLAGFGLKRTLLDSATLGGDSPHKSTSAVPGLMNPSQLQ
jgi:DNA-directed RNA polymerase subunit beta'